MNLTFSPKASMETIKQIGKFIIWWWEGLSPSTRSFSLMTIWISSLLPGLYFFGPAYFLVFFGSFILFLLSVLIKWMYDGIMESWTKFQMEQDRERQRVADKLRGSVPDIYARPASTDRAQEILAKLRAKITP